MQTYIYMLLSKLIHDRDKLGQLLSKLIHDRDKLGQFKSACPDLNSWSSQVVKWNIGQQVWAF